MNCDLWRSQVIEAARGRLSRAIDRDRVVAHARLCPSCGLLMEEQLGLTAAFEEFAAGTEVVPPADLEAFLLSEFEANKPSHRGHLKIAAAIAAVAAALVWLAAKPRAGIAPQPSQVRTLAAIPAEASAPGPPLFKSASIKSASKPVRRHAAKAPADAGSGDAGPGDAVPGDMDPFVSVPYTVPLDPRERVVVMRMDMPVTALAAVGLAVAAPDPLASARTDVIIGEDGRIRAIRLLSISDPNLVRSVNP